MQPMSLVMKSDAAPTNLQWLTSHSEMAMPILLHCPSRPISRSLAYPLSSRQPSPSRLTVQEIDLRWTWLWAIEVDFWHTILSSVQHGSMCSRTIEDGIILWRQLCPWGTRHSVLMMIVTADLCYNFSWVCTTLTTVQFDCPATVSRCICQANDRSGRSCQQTLVCFYGINIMHLLFFNRNYVKGFYSQYK